MFETVVAIVAAHHAFRPGLVQTRIEHELAAVLGILLRRHDAPAGDDLGEARDVVLRIAGAHTDGMQLENLARQIFVDALAAALAGDRVRSHRLHIVEVEQHRRMRLDREQHVGEGAGNMRPDRFAFESAAQRAHRTFIGRHAEMVRPEPDQPLGETGLRSERGVEARFGLFQINLLRHAGRLFRLGVGFAVALRHVPFHGGRLRRLAFGVFGGFLFRFRRQPRRLALLSKRNGRAQGFAGVQQVVIADLAAAGAIEIGEQRRPDVGKARARLRRKAKTIERGSGQRARIGGHAFDSFLAAPGPVLRRDSGNIAVAKMNGS